MGDKSTVFLTDTLVFLAVWVILCVVLSLYVRTRAKDEEDKSLYVKMTISYLSLAIFMMYMMWVCCYMHHMNPLIVPSIAKPEQEEILACQRKDILNN